jgi:hypothetical protein
MKTRTNVHAGEWIKRPGQPPVWVEDPDLDPINYPQTGGLPA